MRSGMTILFVTNNYTPYSGGVVSSIDTFRTELEAQGHIVYVVTLDFLGSQQPPEHHVIRLQCPLRFQVQKKHIALPFSVHRQLDDIIRTYMPDIVHVHHPFLLGPAASTIAYTYTIPTVFTYHTIYEAYAHYTRLPERFARFIIQKKVATFCRRVDGIIVPSSSVAQQVTQYDITCPIACIPTPVAPFFLEHKKLHVSVIHAPLQLLYVGRFEPEKNVRMLLDLMTLVRHEDVSITFAGYGSQTEALQKYAYEHLNFSEHIVRFSIKPSKEQLLSLYTQSDVFLFPSRTDTQGIVLAEAMACGLPVIAVDGPGQRDIIQNGYNGFMVEHEQEMASKLRILAHDTILLGILSEGARTTSARFGSAVCTKRLVDFYKKVGQL